MGAHKVEYRPLAAWLQDLPLDATYADFLIRMGTFRDCDPEFWGWVMNELAIAPAVDYWRGLEWLCELLGGQNPRFLRALFLDWILEGR